MQLSMIYHDTLPSLFVNVPLCPSFPAVAYRQAYRAPTLIVFAILVLMYSSRRDRPSGNASLQKIPALSMRTSSRPELCCTLEAAEMDPSNIMSVSIGATDSSGRVAVAAPAPPISFERRPMRMS